MPLSKYQKIGLYSIPVIIGGVAIYLVVKTYKIPSPKQGAKNSDGSTPQPKILVTNSVNESSVNAQYFPLQKGSDNDYVKELQDVLGVDVDGDFGPKTLAALQQQVGKSTVTSLSDLSNVEDQILAQDADQNNLDYKNQNASLILSQYQNEKWLIVENDTVWNQVTENNDGTYSKTGMQISFNSGTKINLTDYVPFAINPSNSNIIIESTGTNSNFFDKILGNNMIQALWSANPNDLILQA